eukprot:289831-Pleurochrysis_carterae.AAC.1
MNGRTGAQPCDSEGTQGPVHSATRALRLVRRHARSRLPDRSPSTSTTLRATRADSYFLTTWLGA